MVIHKASKASFNIRNGSLPELLCGMDIRKKGDLDPEDYPFLEFTTQDKKVTCKKCLAKMGIE